MIETVSVKVNGKTYQYCKGITLLEIANEVEKERKHPILLAKINNSYKELSSSVTENCEIEFLDLSSREGNRCHVNGLVYMLVYAVKKLYGQKEDIIVQHSLDKGIYIETTFRLTETKLASIKECMKALIEADIPITKVIIDRLEAIKYFEGEHDFKGFKASGTSSKSSVRTIYKADVIEDGERIYIELTGSGFLYNMVRIISGTLVDVGLGKIDPEEISSIIDAKDRSKAGKTLPAHGLCLVKVEY